MSWSAGDRAITPSIRSDVDVTTNMETSGGQSPERLVDGSGLNTHDQHSINVDAMWSGDPNLTEPSYLLFAFNHAYQLYEMFIWNYNMQWEVVLGYGLKNVTLEYSQDGQTWSTLGDYELAQAPGQNTYTHNSRSPCRVSAPSTFA